MQRAFPRDYKGFYLDVGANEPVDCSVTKHFSVHGWRGINIEPQPALHEKLCADRPDDVNLNIGVSDREATLEFFECAANPGLSTFSASLADQHRRDRGMEFVARHLPVRTLTEVCEAHVRGPIDFLKIDAEGFERQVVLGLDWARWRPRIVLVEAAFPERWEPLLHAANYLSATFDGINLYYVRGEEPELLEFFKAPLSVLDVFTPYGVKHSLDALEARASVWERRSELWEERAGEAGRRAAIGEQQAAHWERWAAGWERRAADLERSLDESRRLASELEGRAADLERNLDASERRAADLERNLDASERRAADLERSLAASERRAAASEHELAMAGAELAGYRAYGPNALRIARKAQRLAARHPKLSRAFKRAVGIGRAVG
ncbi:FkbM family methyltransferase [Paludisphaera soli]|uniref:FkbM family methyltransferase n=1 Tax=Paludisphaera soli TaxID=2712865 RepID=UPI0013EC02E8|nr:FkbM family methyltransferase [Paludisphaera soli]